MAQLQGIRELFLKQSIEYIGVCLLEEIQPLIKCRAINRLPQEAHSVITAIFPYYTGDYPEKNISRYTLGKDYHNIVSDILKEISASLKLKYPQNDFQPFCDISPINEVLAAQKSGLGVMGRNNQLINEKYGSYVFVGCIVTDLKLNPTAPKEGDCLNCTLCIKHCPTNALGQNFCKDICLSHITQKKGELTEAETELVKKGGLIWGCDVCTDICPMNKNPIITPINRFKENIIPIINEDNISEAISEKALGYRGRAVLERNMQIVLQVPTDTSNFTNR